MNLRTRLFFSLLLLPAALVPAGCQQAGPAGQSGATRVETPLLGNLGGYQRAGVSDSPEAQAWFDQGLNLLYGFNHDEAIRSFIEATRIDPDCGMAWWGIAYANGLHINNPIMDVDHSKAAYDAAQKALGQVDKASPADAALIRAVATRYIWPAPEERSALDRAYAEAMGEAWRAHRDDPDVGALYAESLMDLQPWDLWTREGHPKGRAAEIVQVLQDVLAQHPKHPGANHFYIHAVEASPDPKLALAAADRLVDLVPGSGHLVHMPSHVYIQLGRYREASEANERAIAADRAYFARAPEPDFYHLYSIHNFHFLAFASMMEGRFESAMRAAREMEADVPDHFLRKHTELADGLMATPLHVLIRFGKWEQVLEEPDYPEYRLLSRALRRYARGVSLSALGRTKEARAELAAFDKVAAQVGEDWWVGVNPAPEVLRLARLMLLGELLFREGEREQAFESLRQAVALEDSLTYDEPPGWMHPVRHALGALLLADDRFEEAAKVYRTDLQHHPENGWALLGLSQALEGLGSANEAEAVQASFRKVWSRADCQPTSSCYCEPGE